jgi:hypothetical protein
VEDFLIAGGIAILFLAPALLRPGLGRVVLSAMFLGGGLFNLAYTLPNAPGSLQNLVASARIPVYREVLSAAAARNATPALVLAVVAFEVATGVLILWRGPLARGALIAAGAWTVGMLPLIPPHGLPIGIALTGAPGLAALILARRTYPHTVFALVDSASRRPLGRAPHRGRNSMPRAPFRAWLRLAVQPISAVLIVVVLWGVFLLVLHPWFMNWGATPAERAAVLPGDSAPPKTYFTRAISIQAPPSAVWPWLLAIGQDRAGFLSNDYLENLTGADIHNADVLRPEWRQRALGDRVPMASPGLRALGGDATSTTIRMLEPERVIADAPGRFVLLPIGHSATRLLLRESLVDPIRAGAAWVLWDPMHFVMEERMLQGIKERAEGRPLVPPVIQAAAHVGWALAALGLLGVFLSRRAWRAWLLLPVTVPLPALWLTSDLNSVLAGFLACGITVAGFLAFGWRWWAPYLLVASAVALVLLLAPDSYAAIGLTFLVLMACLAGTARGRIARVVGVRLRRQAQRAPAATG